VPNRSVYHCYNVEIASAPSKYQGEVTTTATLIPRNPPPTFPHRPLFIGPGCGAYADLPRLGLLRSLSLADIASVASESSQNSTETPNVGLFLVLTSAFEGTFAVKPCRCTCTDYSCTKLLLFLLELLRVRCTHPREREQNRFLGVKAALTNTDRLLAVEF
jgi:hypothetical protein